MPQARSKSLGPIGLIAFLLALGLIALVYFEGRGPAAPINSERSSPEEPGAPAPQGQSALEGVDVAAPTGERMLAPTTQGATRAKAQTEVTPEPGASLTSTTVEVHIADNPWLAPDLNHGSLRWGPMGDIDVEYNITFGSPTRGSVSLAGPPSAAAEFHGLTVEGLLLSVDALEILKRPKGTAYRLQTSLAKGATLVWATGAIKRPPVNVAVGGRLAPPSRKAFPHGVRDGLVESRSGLELPLVLPRLAKAEPVWVGAPNMMWRSFPVTPGAQTVEVTLSAAAAIRVLHDPPGSGMTLYVFTTAYPKGDTDSRAFRDGSPIAFNERPATAHEVWVTDRDDKDAKPLSHRARLDLVAGETAIVDLTAEHARANLGGLRLHLRGSPETIKLAGGEIRPDIKRKKTSGAPGGWERAGELARVANGTGGGSPPERLIFEAIGLEPLPHRITVAPFGASVTQRVIKGETQVVEIDLDAFGWVELVFPEGYSAGGTFVSLIRESPDPNDRSHIPMTTGFGLSPLTPRPVAIGAYTAEVITFADESDQPPLASGPFVVQKGATTMVTLEIRPPMQIDVEARDAATNEPITLDLSFWVGLSVVDEESSKSLVRSTSLQGDSDAYRGIQWQLKHIGSPAKIIIPESPFWTFEQPIPAALEHESTIVLRAHAKD